jgi:hypothetical protein
MKDIEIKFEQWRRDEHLNCLNVQKDFLGNKYEVAEKEYENSPANDCYQFDNPETQAYMRQKSFNEGFNMGTYKAYEFLMDLIQKEIKKN